MDFDIFLNCRIYDRHCLCIILSYYRKTKLFKVIMLDFGLFNRSRGNRSSLRTRELAQDSE